MRLLLLCVAASFAEAQQEKCGDPLGASSPYSMNCVGAESSSQLCTSDSLCRGSGMPCQDCFDAVSTCVGSCQTRECASLAGDVFQDCGGCIGPDPNKCYPGATDFPLPPPTCTGQCQTTACMNLVATGVDVVQECGACSGQDKCYPDATDFANVVSTSPTSSPLSASFSASPSTSPT